MRRRPLRCARRIRENETVRQPSMIRGHVPLAVLLVGIAGSGKTTLARALERRGLVRLSVDEQVHRLHGRYGIDYPIFSRLSLVS